MIKKILAGVLAAITVFGTTACGSKYVDMGSEREVTSSVETVEKKNTTMQDMFGTACTYSGVLELSDYVITSKDDSGNYNFTKNNKKDVNFSLTIDDNKNFEIKYQIDGETKSYKFDYTTKKGYMSTCEDGRTFDERIVNFESLNTTWDLLSEDFKQGFIDNKCVKVSSDNKSLAITVNDESFFDSIYNALERYSKQSTEVYNLTKDDALYKTTINKLTDGKYDTSEGIAAKMLHDAVAKMAAVVGKYQYSDLCPAFELEMIFNSEDNIINIDCKTLTTNGIYATGQLKKSEPEDVIFNLPQDDTTSQDPSMVNSENK